jgi:flagellar biosynthesis protein FlhG
MLEKKLWSIGGGKGGVGKSIFTLGLGICLARLGKKVILLDADLGGANLHTLMGVRYPQCTIEDFLLKRVGRLEDTLIQTQVDGISLICGADDILGAANPKYVQKLRLLQQIEALPADLVLLDLGAGTSFNVLDFFNFSRGKIVVFTNQVTSLQNVYGFLKAALFRRLSREFARDQETLELLYKAGSPKASAKIDSIPDLLLGLQKTDQPYAGRITRILEDYAVFLVVNMVKGEGNLKAADIIQKVAQDFLSVACPMLGHLPYDPKLEESVNRIIPFPLDQEKSPAAVELQRMALRILHESGLSSGKTPDRLPAQEFSSAGVL